MNKTIKLAIFTLILMLAANIAFAQTSTAANADKTYQEWHDLGIRQLSEEKFEDAVYSFTQCLKLKADSVECLIKRGAAYPKTNKFTPAIADLDKAIELAPNSSEAYLERGKLSYGDKQIEYFNKAIELEPDSAKAYFQRGVTFSFTDKKKAFTDFSKTIELDPTFFEAYISRANIYQLNNKIDLALADYSSAIRVQPDGRTFYIRGLTYFDFGKYAEAVADFNKSAELNPNHYWTFKKRAEAYRKLGKIKLAEADETKAAQIGRPN